MLKIDELKVSYGGIEAVKGITFEVPERQIVTLIGANGAGKSTTLRTIAGLVKPAHGRIHLQGEDITGLSPDRIVSKGVTVLLIEQNANMALKIADLGYVLETGRITLTGSGRDLLKNEDVKKAYLGT